MNAGIPIPAGAAAPTILKEFDLPSGAHVVIHRGKGRDLRMGLMAAGSNADQYRIMYALIARLARIDGQMVTMESIDEMDLLDAQALLTEGGRVLSPLQKGRLQIVEKAESSGTASSPNSDSEILSSGEYHPET